MIKKISACILAVIAGMIYFTPEGHHSYSFTSGSPGGLTGSPLDGVNCRSCHSGGAAVNRPNVISTNIPSGGYIPGQTYDLTLSFSEPGRSKFGFELVSENGSSRKGSFAIKDNQTKTLGGSSAPRITHIQGGTSAPGGNKTWNVRWTAPSAGSGAITFYAALNASNSDGSDSGDNIYLTSHTVQEDLSNGIEESTGVRLQLFPNPCVEKLRVEGLNMHLWQITNLSGQLIKSGQEAEIDVKTLTSGIYLFSVPELGIQKRFIKQ